MKIAVFCSFMILVVAASVRSEPLEGAHPAVDEHDSAVECTIIGENVSADACGKIGCVWNENKGDCRIKGLAFGYGKTGETTTTDLGFDAQLKLTKAHPNVDSWSLSTIQVESWTDKILRVKITRPSSASSTSSAPFETRPHLPSFMKRPDGAPSNPSLTASIETASENSAFSYLKVVRGSRTIFQTLPGAFILSDGFLSLTNVGESSQGAIYGLGEHFHPTLRRSGGELWGIFARDHPVGPNTRNLYGAHPFYVALESAESDGETKAHGVLLLNSNAMDVAINEDYSITYRTIGGILDFFIIDGPSMHEVVDEYYNLIGRPMMPPYWTLGFQLCRYGYRNTSHIRTVFDRVKNLGVPFDTQYADIDYMDRRLSFTYDKENFAGLPELTQYVHDQGRKFMVIVDPAIAFDEQTTGLHYKPKNLGLEKDLFIKDARTGKPLEGRVWPPGTTVFPDFTDVDNAIDYYAQLNEDFYSNQSIRFDGLWIDMNEPANFEVGSTTGCAKNRFNFPEWIPHINRDKYIFEKTICMDAQQNWGRHYDVHSLYGYSQAVVTYNAYKRMSMFQGKRPFVLTRSTFPGSGHYAAHWLGDNSSEWEQLKHSIIAMFEFGLFGIPMNGPDICGFFGQTTEELCTRWMQIGAFYPFSRNHNALGEPEQDPGAFSQAHVDAAIKAMEMRYKLLPYLYTLLYRAHGGQGGLVARALVYNYPDDVSTWDLSTQFMWGKGLLISPVLDHGVNEVDAYFPGDQPWYDFVSGVLASPGDNKRQVLAAPIDKINVHVAGGNILPLQVKGDGEIGRTTSACRSLPLALLAALDSSGAARGELFWDDGETEDAKEGSLAEFAVAAGELKISQSKKGGSSIPSLDTLWIYDADMKTEPNSVTIDGIETKHFAFHHDDDKKMLQVTNMNLAMDVTHVIAWR